MDASENYHVKWDFDETREYIIFTVRVRTLGWVGFGLSNNGGMIGSDMVIGWVKDGQAYLTVSNLYHLLFSGQYNVIYIMAPAHDTLFIRVSSNILSIKSGPSLRS